MPDPEAQDSNEFVHDVARNGLRYDTKTRVRDYVERENPRGLPEKWIEHYLERDKTLLALDVMRAFDKSSTTERALGWERIKLRILTAALLGSWGLFGWLAKFVLDHLSVIEQMMRTR